MWSRHTRLKRNDITRSVTVSLSSSESVQHIFKKSKTFRRLYNGSSRLQPRGSSKTEKIAFWLEEKETCAARQETFSTGWDSCSVETTASKILEFVLRISYRDSTIRMGGPSYEWVLSAEIIYKAIFILLCRTESLQDNVCSTIG